VVNTRVAWRVDFSPAGRSIGKHDELMLNISHLPLTIRVAAPIADARIRVTLIDVESKLTFAIGNVDVVKGGMRSASLSTKPFYSTLGTGRKARVVLDCEGARPQCAQLFYAGTERDP
jgi:hypothetical protein